jgi:hypothetical protein
MDGVWQLAKIHAQPGKVPLAHELGGGEHQELLLVPNWPRPLHPYKFFGKRGVVSLEPRLIGLVVEMHAVKVRLADEAE